MQHVANMNNRSLICSGHSIPNGNMSDADIVWATSSNVIQLNNQGRWYHTKITDRDRRDRANSWNPDTGPWRKGVNY